MNLRSADNSKSRFAAYVEGLVSVIGHADRAGPLRDYCLGLIMPCERKSVEPMAAVTAPDRTAAQHQSLLHFVGQSPWSDEKVLAKVGEMVLPAIESQGPIEAWIIDDTGFPKKGEHSVGVARQYCGQLGKRENCQVAVSLSLANHHASLPVAWRLYLPKERAADLEHRRKAGVPDEIDFKTKPEIALEQIEAALKAGLSRGVVLMDAGYGCNTNLRTGISALSLTYVAGILPHTTVWTPGTGPLPPKKWSGRGQRPKRLRRDDEHKPISVEELALSLPKRSWRRIEWREGTAEPLSSRFARVRVRAAHRDYTRSESRPEEWLLIEWPEGEKKPAKYWLSTLPKNIFFRKLVDLTKLRWRIERDYQELKQEVGLGHSKDEAGAASITMPRCASRPTDSWSPRGRGFPPHDLVAPLGSKNLPFPKVIDPEAPPPRTERHVPNSIATMRRRLIIALVSTLSRCPCCATPVAKGSRRKKFMTQ
jgi:SRSO17 transposase